MSWQPSKTFLGAYWLSSALPYFIFGAGIVYADGRQGWDALVILYFIMAAGIWGAVNLVPGLLLLRWAYRARRLRLAVTAAFVLGALLPAGMVLLSLP